PFGRVAQKRMLCLLIVPRCRGRHWHRVRGDRLPGFTGPSPSTSLDKVYSVERRLSRKNVGGQGECVCLAEVRAQPGAVGGRLKALRYDVWLDEGVVAGAGVVLDALSHDHLEGEAGQGWVLEGGAQVDGVVVATAF